MPHTPVRGILSSTGSGFPSPSSLRADEDMLVVELGARRIRAGFAGDAVPKAVVDLGPRLLRRTGDYRVWEPGHTDDWRARAVSSPNGWYDGYELWSADVRRLDLGLVGDKIERVLREAFTR